MIRKTYKKMLRKLLLSFLLAAFIFISNATVFTSAAKAQDSTGKWYSPGVVEWYMKVYDEKTSPPTDIFGERYTAAQVNWIIWSLFTFPFNILFDNNTDLIACMFSSVFDRNIMVTRCASGIGEYITNTIDKFLKPLQISENTKNKGFFATVFEDRQLSGVSYLKQSFGKFKLVPTAIAQEGFGYSRLNVGPIPRIWRASRDFAYLIFVVVIVVFSFMIMFKVKISPQAVITIQSAIPKVAGALILVTFSFAIAGFLIDLMYVIFGLLALFLSSIGGSGVGTSQFTANYRFLTGNFGLRGGVPLLIFFAFYIAIYALVAIMSIIASINGFSLTSTIISVLLLLFALVLIIILIFNWFRIIFLLFKTLAQIYLSVFIAPIQIALGSAVKGLGFASWVKSFLSKLAIFPAMGMLLFISFLFLGMSAELSIKGVLGEGIIGTIIDNLTTQIVNLTGAQGGFFNFIMDDLWGPPWLGNSSSASGIAFLLLSSTCIMLIPKVGKLIDGFMAGRPDIETAMKEVTGPLTTLGGFASKEATEAGVKAAAYRAYYTGKRPASTWPDTGIPGFARRFLHKAAGKQESGGAVPDHSQRG